MYKPYLHFKPPILIARIFPKTFPTSYLNFLLPPKNQDPHAATSSPLVSRIKMNPRLLAAVVSLFFSGCPLNGYPTDKLQPISNHGLRHYARHSSGTNSTVPTTVLHCETSMFSPLREDVKMTESLLIGSTRCVQTTRVREGATEACVKLATYGSSVIGLCGPYNIRVRCADVVTVIREIRKCDLESYPDQVGGRVEYPWGALIVYSPPA
ncbi:hypothetical protein DFP73DRAFT_564520, partial [Morchella snyderi]